MVGDPQASRTPPAPPVKVYQCPGCGGSIKIHAVGQSISAACESCGTIVDVANESLQILFRARERLRYEPAIPLGTKGKLRGAVWQVIGFLRRCDESAVYYWSEYLLFNPYKGFRWLTEQKGHWNYVSPLKQTPKVDPYGQSVELWHDTYQVYEKGEARVTYVAGEFYWRVKVGDTVQVADYIHPPHIVSMERSSTEVTWSAGEYFPAKEVREAFRLAALPDPQGVAPNEPFRAGESAPVIATSACFFAIAAIMIQMFCSVIFSPSHVYDGSLLFAANDRRSQSTPHFELTGRTTNVEVTPYINVDNSWADFTLTLTDADTGKSYDSDQEISYYHGYDTDGYWSEGSRTRKITFSSIPSGAYFVTVEPGAKSWTGDLRIDLTIRRDVPMWGNCLVAILLLVTFPLALWLYRRHIEVQRWSNSDYSPYRSGEG